MNSIEQKLWKVFCGRISKAPVTVIDHGDGTITVPKSCRKIQPKIDQFESYHLSEKEAVIHILAEAQREVNNAERNLKSAKDRLKRARSRFVNYVSNPT